MLPNWLQQLAADCTEQERQSLRINMNKTQVERDSRLKASHKAKGLRQVTVWVPAEKAEELKAMAAQWRSNQGDGQAEGATKGAG